MQRRVFFALGTIFMLWGDLFHWVGRWMKRKARRAGREARHSTLPGLVSTAADLAPRKKRRRKAATADRVPKEVLPAPSSANGNGHGRILGGWSLFRRKPRSEDAERVERKLASLPVGRVRGEKLEITIDTDRRTRIERGQTY